MQAQLQSEETEGGVNPWRDFLKPAASTGDVEKTILERARLEGITFDEAWDIESQSRRFVASLMASYDYRTLETAETELGRSYLAAMDHAATPYARRSDMKKAFGLDADKKLDEKRGTMKFTSPMQLTIAAINALNRLHGYYRYAMDDNDNEAMMYQIQETQLMIMLDIDEHTELIPVVEVLSQFFAELHDTSEGRSYSFDRQGKQHVHIDKDIANKYRDMVRNPLKHIRTNARTFRTAKHFNQPAGYSQAGLCIWWNLHMGTSHVPQCSCKTPFHIKVNHNCLACVAGYPHPIVNCPVLRAGFKTGPYQPNYATADYSKIIVCKEAVVRQPFIPNGRHGGGRGGGGGYRGNNNWNNDFNQPRGGGHGNGGRGRDRGRGRGRPRGRDYRNNNNNNDDNNGGKSDSQKKNDGKKAN